MTFRIPESLAISCARTESRREWLEALPDLLARTIERWGLSVGDPFDGQDVSCSWVARATLRDGSRAVLKVAMPHMEADHEIAALRLLDGDPTVRLLESDDESQAMLLEMCEPGTPLRHEFQPEQDVIIAEILKRYWRVPPADNPFRPLSALIRHWTDETLEREADWHDSALVRDGLDVFAHLISTSMGEDLLATDLHAGNVLRADREPWLMIDPKPFVGERAYDATQYLVNCRSRLRSGGLDTIRRMSDLLEVSFERVRLWTFARLAAEPRDDWDDDATALARILAP